MDIVSLEIWLTYDLRLSLYLPHKIIAEIFKIIFEIRPSRCGFFILPIVLELAEHLIAVDQTDERLETLAFVINFIVLTFCHKFLLDLGQDLVVSAKQCMRVLIISLIVITLLPLIRFLLQ